jgi:hypothetical protein
VSLRLEAGRAHDLGDLPPPDGRETELRLRISGVIDR